jgi:serine/threonine protein kinase
VATRWYRAPELLLSNNYGKEVEINSNFAEDPTVDCIQLLGEVLVVKLLQRLEPSFLEETVKVLDCAHNRVVFPVNQEFVRIHIFLHE